MSFEFDCPRCGRRCRIGAQQRGVEVQCAGCRLTFPGPDFPLQTSGVSRGWAGMTLAESNRRRTVGHAGGAPHPAGVASSDDAHAASAEWQRPVAKVFTRAERSYSLHHLMMGLRRLLSPDASLPVEGRRHFEFYCGACGRLQGARVWDIASQTLCVACGELMIVPSPPHRGRRWIPESAGFAESLYCPGCGAEAAVSDRRRVRQSYCERCRGWF